MNKTHYPWSSKEQHFWEFADIYLLHRYLSDPMGKQLCIFRTETNQYLPLSCNMSAELSTAWQWHSNGPDGWAAFPDGSQNGYEGVDHILLSTLAHPRNWRKSYDQITSCGDAEIEACGSPISHQNVPRKHLISCVAAALCHSLKLVINSITTSTHKTPSYLEKHSSWNKTRALTGPFISVMHL